jgi:hypothetical protein
MDRAETDESGASAPIRASDAERAGVVEQLGRAVGEGRLDLGTYADRAGAAYAAVTRGELARLTGDLPEPAAVQPAAAVSPTSTERLSAVLGNESRKGYWSVPGHLVARSVLGDCHIELQHARLQQPVTTIEATAILGAVTIFVPDGIDVRLTGSAVLGAKSCKAKTKPADNAPVLRVICDARCGSVTVRPPKWWERR